MTDPDAIPTEIAAAGLTPPEAAPEPAPPGTVPTQDATQPATPPEAPLAMPVQALRGPVPRGPRAEWPRREVVLARLVAFGGAAVIALVGYWQMLAVFGDHITPLQYVLLGLFTLTFAWVGFSFCSMLAGALAPPPVSPRDPGQARVAIVMPVYHEDVGFSFGMLAALAQDLAAQGLAGRAEVFVLSDSRDPAFFAEETLGIMKLRAVSPLPVWYRRRTDNTGRKAGNVAEFVRRWGARYDQMVVLDADSILTGEVVRELSARMSADPALALIQTMPVLVGGQTIFARVVQFAGRVYGPSIARGVAAWSGDNGNFWGHNAIIRVSAFAQCCGLPELAGKQPFGGTIMSHDFVEAALLRRAGWKVRLDWDLRGSYEGCPPTLLDMAVRERRWAQGNLQHLRVMFARGFTAISRAHFTIGILGFVMSPVWLTMILVGLALTGAVLLSRPDYFPQTYQLFPNWPTFDPTRMKWLFAAAMAFLLVPKFIAIVRAWQRPVARAVGGKRRLFASGLFEIVLSALIAPVQMLIQTRQIFDILLGRHSGWESQVRRGSMPPWGVVWRHHALHVAVGLFATVVLIAMDPSQLIWLSPILAGLILAPFTSRWTASSVFGRWARIVGLLATPEERKTPAILSDAIAQFRRVRPPGDPLAVLARDPELRAAHLALSTPLPRATLAERMPAISAGAKIAAAGSRAEALGFLDRAETVALLSDSDLLEQWSRLPV